MYGRHTDGNGMLIGTPSQTNNYLDMQCTPNYESTHTVPFWNTNRLARALDRPNLNLRYLLLNFFLC